MNYEKMGICVTILVLVSVIGIAGISSGDFDIGVGEVNLPQINAGTNTDTSNYAYYEWCYQMGKTDC